MRGKVKITLLLSFGCFAQSKSAALRSCRAAELQLSSVLHPLHPHWLPPVSEAVSISTLVSSYVYLDFPFFQISFF